MKKLLFYSLFFFFLLSCKKEKFKGVIIGDTLLVHQSFSENKRMGKLISEATNHDERAIAELINFPNGGGGGSYDLGYVITQIIYKLKEENFIKLIKDLSELDKSSLEGLIMVGLEYGDNDYDGIMDDKKIENEFPTISSFLKKEQ